MKRTIPFIASTLILGLLTACGGDSNNIENPAVNNDPAQNNDTPARNNDDVAENNDDPAQNNDTPPANNDGPDLVEGCSEDDTDACLYTPEASLESFAEFNDPERLETDNGEIVSDMTVTYQDVTGTVRKVPLLIFAPEGDGPFPIVTLSHGGAAGAVSGRTKLTEWGEIIAKAGYVSIMISHVPRSDAARLALCEAIEVTAEACQTFKFLNFDRPNDIAAILDALDELGRVHPGLGPRMDPSRVAVAGHSAGSGAALTVAGAERLVGDVSFFGEDARPLAFLAFSPQGPDIALDNFGERSWDGVERPVFFATGSGDETDGVPDADTRRVPFESAPAGEGKYLLFIDDERAIHTTYALSNVPDPRVEQWLVSGALAFLDAHLKDSERALEYIRSRSLEVASDDRLEWKIKVD